MRKTLALYNYKKQDGTVYHIAVINGEVTGADAYVYNDTTLGWDPQGLSLTMDATYNFCTFLDTCFMFSRDEATLTFDGTTWSTYNAIGAPQARYGCVFQERLHLFNTNHGKSRMEYSSLPAGNSISWTPTDFEEINQDDGDEIMWAGVLGSRLIILKKYSMFTYDGNSLIKIPNSTGTSSPKSVTQFRDSLYFYSDGTIWQFDGATPQKISENIEDIIKDVDLTDTVSVDYAGGGGVDGRYYYLFVGSLAANNINRAMIVIDLITLRYTVFSLYDTPTTFCQSTIDGIPYMTFGTTESEIMYFDNSSTSDNTRNIETLVETKSFDLGQPETVKQFNSIVVMSNPSGFQFGYRLDNDDQIHQLGYVSKHEQRFYFPKDCKGHRISFRISDISTTTPFKFDGFSLDYADLGVPNA